MIVKILTDDEIAEGTKSLNSKQRELFNVVHAWVKDYLKNDGPNVEPVHKFIFGNGATVYIHLVKVIHKCFIYANMISNLLTYHESPFT